MKTIEELRGMTQEDLVRLVQELEENLQKKNENVRYWMVEHSKAESRMNALKDAVKSLSLLI